MAEFRCVRRAMPALEVAELRQALLSSPLVGPTTLTRAFEASRGFGMVFTEAGRAQAESRVPALVPFLRLALGCAAEAHLRSFWQRRRPIDPPNAWYLNLLVVGSGGSVGAHVDATLAQLAELPGATPRVVSVLYLEVPPGGGGELVLARGQRLAGVVRPREGLLVHFRGDLLHQVRAPLATREGAQRVSLVLEQYAFPAEALPRLPTFRLDSPGKFLAALEAASRRPLPPFEVDSIGRGS